MVTSMVIQKKRAEIIRRNERQLQKSNNVIPAEAGIQNLRPFLDTGFRRCDGFVEF
jgi:hypothetical protein